MNATNLAVQLEELTNSIGENSASYSEAVFWESVGATELDEQLTRLADLFIGTPPDQQQMVRDAVHPRSLWNLIAYVRRLSMLIMATSDSMWLRRALAVAAIEDGRFDYRDLIVSLVIARAASEHVGIDHIPHFIWCLDSFHPTSHESFTNARDHAESDVHDILRSFGPSELRPNRRKRSS